MGNDLCHGHISSTPVVVDADHLGLASIAAVAVAVAASRAVILVCMCSTWATQECSVICLKPGSLLMASGWAVCLHRLGPQPAVLLLTQQHGKLSGCCSLTESLV
jgi:hypothetical protein